MFLYNLRKKFGCKMLYGENMKHENITNKFIRLLKKDNNLKRLVEKDLEIAKRNNPDKNFNPAQSLEELYDFLDWSVKCMPWEVLKDVKYPTLYKRIEQCIGYFWYILDQPLDELKNCGFYYPSLHYLEPISSWEKEYCKAWGKFLSSKKSWKPEYYNKILMDEGFGLKYGWYGNTNIWKSFNEFFARKLADKSFRPIAQCDVVAPADSSPKGYFKIDKDSKFIQPSGVKIKSANFNSVKQLIGFDSKYCDKFAGGILTHVFLDVNDYHRYHFPVSGEVLEVRKIPALNAGGGITQWNNSTKNYDYFNETGFQMIETRDCVILKTNFGLVAILPVGMSQICSCNFEKNVKVGAKVSKGDPMGYFQFGGSDIVMIFQKGVKLKNLLAKEKGDYLHVLMGQPYAEIEMLK